jgi:hypothetical protein
LVSLPDIMTWHPSNSKREGGKNVSIYIHGHINQTANSTALRKYECLCPVMESPWIP